MREVELKAVVPDVPALRARLAGGGAVPTRAGALVDQRYDTPERTLIARDHVLRLRVFRSDAGAEHATLDFKGPTGRADGYKVRDELSASVTDAGTLAAVLAALGYVVVREIEREIEQFDLFGAVVRIERYPRLDVLVEIEGAPDAIERAIAATGLPRDTFSAGRLPDFIAAFEARTGTRAAVSARELAGDYALSRTGA